MGMVGVVILVLFGGGRQRKRTFLNNREKMFLNLYSHPPRPPPIPSYTNPIPPSHTTTSTCTSITAKTIPPHIPNPHPNPLPILRRKNRHSQRRPRSRYAERPIPVVPNPVRALGAVVAF